METRCLKSHFLQFTRVRCSGSGKEVAVDLPDSKSSGKCPDCAKRMRLTFFERIPAHNNLGGQSCVGEGKAPMENVGYIPRPLGHPNY